MKTVNFIEAVNSGKRVKPVEYSQFFYTTKDLMNGDYTLQELVNTKFIIEEKEATITESKFAEITANVIADYPNNYTATSAITRAFRDEFGF